MQMQIDRMLVCIFDLKTEHFSHIRLSEAK